MLTTYQRLMSMAKVTRTGSVTYDNRSEHDLVRELQAQVDVLKARLREMEQSERPEEAASAARTPTR